MNSLITGVPSNKTRPSRVSTCRPRGLLFVFFLNRWIIRFTLPFCGGQDASACGRVKHVFKPVGDRVAHEGHRLPGKPMAAEWRPRAPMARGRPLNEKRAMVDRRLRPVSWEFFYSARQRMVSQVFRPSICCLRDCLLPTGLSYRVVPSSTVSRSSGCANTIEPQHGQPPPAFRTKPQERPKTPGQAMRRLRQKERQERRQDRQCVAWPEDARTGNGSNPSGQAHASPGGSELSQFS